MTLIGIAPRCAALRTPARRSAAQLGGGSAATSRATSSCVYPMCSRKNERRATDRRVWRACAARRCRRGGRDRRVRPARAAAACASAIGFAARTSRTATARRRLELVACAQKRAARSPAARTSQTRFELRFLSRVRDRRRALSGRSPVPAALERALAARADRQRGAASRSQTTRAVRRGRRARCARSCARCGARLAADGRSAARARLAACRATCERVLHASGLDAREVPQGRPASACPAATAEIEARDGPVPLRQAPSERSGGTDQWTSPPLIGRSSRGRRPSVRTDDETAMPFRAHRPGLGNLPARLPAACVGRRRSDSD